jgi:hypothetical protein
MSAAYFEDHPTDSDKVILRKKPYLDKGADYEHGFIDGMQYQMQSSVDKAVNVMSQRKWQNLTDEEIQQALGINAESSNWNLVKVLEWAKKIEAALLEKNA